ncbi:MAG: hypothetical protein Q8P83_03340 [bacterium]|nr:hypothetical protein [bacterium]
MSYIQDILRLIDELHEMLPPSKGNYRPLGSIPRHTYYKSLNRLEMRGLVKKKKKQNKSIVFAVTEKGKDLLKEQTKKVRRNDGYSTLIIFDIPEDKRRARNLFRRYLIRNAFVILQKSVLISGNKPSPEIFKLAKELKISPFITILSGKIDHLKM